MFSTRNALIPKYPDTQCAICKDNYLPEGNDCLVLRCGHLFHATCMNQAFANQTTRSCPLCRHKITPLTFNVLKEVVDGSGPILLFILISPKFRELYVIMKMIFRPNNGRNEVYDKCYVASCLIILGAVLIYQLTKAVFERRSVPKRVNYFPQI